MLRDPKLSRCATLVECVCVNVFREFEFFFFNATSVTSQSVLILKSNSVLRYSTFDYTFFSRTCCRRSSPLLPFLDTFFPFYFCPAFPPFIACPLLLFLHRPIVCRKNGRGEVTFFQVRSNTVGDRATKEIIRTEVRENVCLDI